MGLNRPARKKRYGTVRANSPQERPNGNAALVTAIEDEGYKWNTFEKYRKDFKWLDSRRENRKTIWFIIEDEPNGQAAQSSASGLWPFPSLHPTSLNRNELIRLLRTVTFDDPLMCRLVNFDANSDNEEGYEQGHREGYKAALDAVTERMRAIEEPSLKGIFDELFGCIEELR